MPDSIPGLILATGALLAAAVVPFIIWAINRKDEAAEKRTADLEALQREQQRELAERKRQLEQMRLAQEELKKKKPEISVRTLEVMVIGRPQAGKTQFIWTKQGNVGEPSPTLEKTNEQFLRAIIINNTKYAFNYFIPDIGGDDTFLSVVNEELLVRKPMAIIFVVDHNVSLVPDFSVVRAREHMNAIFSILGTIGNKNRSRCETVLFLINKQDIWGSKYSDNEMITFFKDHLKRFESAGHNVLVSCVSAKTGANLDSALAALERTMML